MLKSPGLLLRSAVMAVALLSFAPVTSPNFIQAQTPGTQPQESAKARSLSAKEQAEVFEVVWKTIKEKYYNPAFNGVDWDAVRNRYQPRIAGVSSDEEFYALLNQMAGELHDAHTRVRSPRQSRERKRQQATSAGVLIYEVEGAPVIFDVAPDSDAARAGVLRGMAVRTIDGKPIGEALAEARREVGISSTERATRILSYSRLIAGEPDTPLKLGLTRPDGTPFEVTLMRRTISTAPQFTARVLPSGYAYIRFNRFRPPAAKQVKEALEKFKDAPGLILDLRSNSGGDGREGLRIAGYFFDEKVPIARIVTRSGKPPSALFGLVSLPKVFEAGEKGNQIYSNPVVILINEGTASTSELIVSGMQERRRAQIVGTQSCGCVLGVMNHRELKGGGELAISEVGFVTPKERTLEGNGIVPDRTITLTLADLQRQRDTALEEAEKYLNDLLKRSPSVVK
jgi:carboxyl-terminal processing protease